MNTGKAKGTSAEMLAVEYLRERGFVQAHRNPPAGWRDIGDIGGIYGVCLEVKAHTQPRHSAWLAEVEREASRPVGGFLPDVAAVIHKPVGKGAASVPDWHVIMTLDRFITLLGFYEAH